MLILKGKLIKAMLAVALCCLACAWPGASRSLAAPLPPAAPDTAAVAFYGWYLDTLSADQDPLSDRHAVFGSYVAQELVARLVKRLQGGRPPAGDYFLQSPGYQSAWRGHVAAATVQRRAGAADVIVTLGNDDGAKRVLALAMVLEDGAWKVRQVALAEARSAESSAEQPVI